MRYMFMTAAAAAILAMASPAAATVVITSGPGAVQPEENVLFNNGPTAGLTIEGITNQTNTLLSITGGETLVASGGQAVLDTMDGTIDSPFTFNTFTNQLLGFDLSDSNLAFTQTEFRLFGGTATLATLTFVDTDGEVFTQALTIPANGFFSAQAIDGQLIDYFSIAANGTIGDVRQVRIGGVTEIGGGGGGAAVPEPATWAMMIVGFGAAGAMMRRRRALVA